MKKLFLIFALLLQTANWAAANTQKSVTLKINPPLTLTGGKDGIIELSRLGEILEHVDRKGVLNSAGKVRSDQFALILPNQPKQTVAFFRPISGLSSKTLTVKVNFENEGFFKAYIKVYHRPDGNTIWKNGVTTVNHNITKAVLTKIKISPSLANHIPAKGFGEYLVFRSIFSRVFYTAYGIFAK